MRNTLIVAEVVRAKPIREHNMRGEGLPLQIQTRSRRICCGMEVAASCAFPPFLSMLSSTRS